MALDTQQKSADGRDSEEFRQLIDADIKANADAVSAANLKFDCGAASRHQRAVRIGPQHWQSHCRGVSSAIRS